MIELRSFSRKNIPQHHPSLEDKASFALEEPTVGQSTGNLFFFQSKNEIYSSLITKFIIKIDIKENVGLSKIKENFLTPIHFQISFIISL